MAKKAKSSVFSGRLRQGTKAQKRVQAKKTAAKQTAPTSFSVLGQVSGLLQKHWRILGGIMLVYLVLNIVFANGLSTVINNFSSVKDNLAASRNFSGALDGFGSLLGGSAGGSDSASVIQSVSIVLMSLVIIWVLRQLLAGKKFSVKEAYYGSMFPLIPFLLVILVINYLFKFKGKTMVLSALGLSQVGEFAFIIFASAVTLGLISKEVSSLGIAVGLVTLIASPFIYNNSMRVWRILKDKFKVFSSLEINVLQKEEIKDHIVILGFGRVGRWVGRALTDHNINYVVVDYDNEIITSCKEKGINAIYGDPVEKEVLEAASITTARAVVIAIPDGISQESVIAHIQTVAPHVKIISRVHFDEDWDKLKLLRVDKLVQPEFEAATSIIRNIFISSGKSKEEISKSIKSIRLSHAKI